jgi:hypothetical protein
MALKDDAIPQEILDSILTRTLTVPPESVPKPLFGIERILCHRAHVSDLPAGDFNGGMHVFVYDAIVKRHAALGNLVSTRHVGSFTVRLVRTRHVGSFTVRLVRESASTSEVWRIIETDSRNKRVVLLTYGSEGDSAREAATQYAASATEIDLTSDFNPDAHFFGERRLPRVPGSGAS